MLHKTKAPREYPQEDAGVSTVTFQVVALENRHDGAQYTALRVAKNGKPPLFIDKEGTARLILEGQKRASGPRRHDYISMRVWHIEDPTELPQSALLAFYERVIADLERNDFIPHYTKAELTTLELARERRLAAAYRRYTIAA